MKTTLYQNQISVKKSPIHGYGVFADIDIAAGELIEECFAIITTQKDRAFKDYYFAAGERDCIPMGYAMIYNHSETPNATYEYDPVSNTVVFKATQLIKSGEEILTYYGTEWFNCRSLPVKKVPLWFRIKLFVLRHRAIFRLITVISICYLSVLLMKRFS